MAVIEIGQKKVINGKIYRKEKALFSCSGCAFYRSPPCPGVVVTASIDEGGAECFRSIWVEVTPEEQAYAERTCVDAVKPVVKTVTLEVVRADPKDNACFYCVFGDPNYATCPFPDEGKCIGCEDGSYFRVKGRCVMDQAKLKDLRERVLAGGPTNAWRLSACLALRDALASCETERDRLRAELDASHDGEDALRSEVAKLRVQIAALQAEVYQLRSREKACATMDQAEKVALVRMGQEIAAILGANDPSPAEIVARVRALQSVPQGVEVPELTDEDDVWQGLPFRPEYRPMCGAYFAHGYNHARSKARLVPTPPQAAPGAVVHWSQMPPYQRDCGTCASYQDPGAPNNCDGCETDAQQNWTPCCRVAGLLQPEERRVGPDEVVVPKSRLSALEAIAEKIERLALGPDGRAWTPLHYREFARGELRNALRASAQAHNGEEAK